MNDIQMLADIAGMTAELIESGKLVRVVRCKDCRYGEPWGLLIGCGTTKGFGITHEPDWFCADGERK